MCEQGTWNHCFPYADRLNYASPILNNVGFALAVEKLAGVTVPERCQYIRVIGGGVSPPPHHPPPPRLAGEEVGALPGRLFMLAVPEVPLHLRAGRNGARLSLT